MYHINIYDFNLDSLDYLLDAQVPEQITLDYKWKEYNLSDAGNKKALLKDVAAFANRLGGQIIIGLKEKEGVPLDDEIGVALDKPDEYIRRVSQIVRAHLDPPVVGIRIEKLKLEGGRYVICIHVPRSLNPPHRVILDNLNRFYIRHNTNTEEASMDELRYLFGFSADLRDKAISFRDQRLSLLRSQHYPKYNLTPPQLVLHCIPIHSLLVGEVVDLASIQNFETRYAPFAKDDGHKEYCLDGRMSVDFNTPPKACTLMLRNGIIEMLGLVNPDGRKSNTPIPTCRFEYHLLRSLVRILKQIDDESYSYPVIVYMSLMNIANSNWAISEREQSLKLHKSELLLPELFISEPIDDEKKLKQKLYTVIDCIWNALGMETSPYKHEFIEGTT